MIPEPSIPHYFKSAVYRPKPIGQGSVSAATAVAPKSELLGPFGNLYIEKKDNPIEGFSFNQSGLIGYELSYLNKEGKTITKNFLSDSLEDPSRSITFIRKPKGELDKVIKGAKLLTTIEIEKVQKDDLLHISKKPLDISGNYELRINDQTYKTNSDLISYNIDEKDNLNIYAGGEVIAEANDKFSLSIKKIFTSALLKKDGEVLCQINNPDSRDFSYCIWDMDVLPEDELGMNKDPELIIEANIKNPRTKKQGKQMEIYSGNASKPALILSCDASIKMDGESVKITI